MVWLTCKSTNPHSFEVSCPGASPNGYRNDSGCVSDLLFLYLIGVLCAFVVFLIVLNVFQGGFFAGIVDNEKRGK